MLSGLQTRKLVTVASVRRNSAFRAEDITVGIVVTYSVTVAAITRCLCPPPPGRSECVTRVTRSCCSGTPTLIPKCVACHQFLQNNPVHLLRGWFNAFPKPKHHTDMLLVSELELVQHFVYLSVTHKEL